MIQPLACRAARSIPRRRWPPSQIGGPPGVSGPGLVGRPVERVEGVRAGHARQVPGPVREERPDDAERRLEPVEPFDDRRERDPERDVLRIVPAGAEADDESTAGDVVEDRQLLGQHGRVTEGGRQDGDPQPFPGNVVGQGSQRGERLQARATTRVAGVGQVVVEPGRFEDVVLADPRPGRVDGRPVGVLGRGLDPDRDPVLARHRARRLAVIREPVVDRAR